MTEQEQGRSILAGHRCLKEGGVVLLADVMREESESLSLYRSRYCGWVRKTFTALDASEFDLACDPGTFGFVPDFIFLVPTTYRGCAGRASLSHL
jgi:hypothetical protein